MSIDVCRFARYIAWRWREMSRIVQLKDIKIYKIFHKIIDRLPSTFPRAALVVHANLEELQQYYMDYEGEEPKEDLPFAFCDGNSFTVHGHLTMNEEPTRDIAWYFLHELGHLYALNRYGTNDKRWKHHETAERYANRFANRWIRKIKKEGWLRI